MNERYYREGELVDIKWREDGQDIKFYAVWGHVGEAKFWKVLKASGIEPYQTDGVFHMQGRVWEEPNHPTVKARLELKEKGYVDLDVFPITVAWILEA